jgi:putative transposase
MRYRAIQEHDRRYPIRLMCRASPAGYYAWASRSESARSVHNRTLLSEIRVIHRESRETYGSPSIWDALMKRGHGVGEHRIARLMRAEGIRAKTVKKWRATTQSNHRLPVAENTLNRQFTAEYPNRVWAGDITYVWTTEGWLYLAVVLDLYSRAVIGWAMDHRLTVDLAEHALTMALANLTPTAGLLHHSDRGRVRRHGVPAAADHAWHDRQHVETGELLGQCLRGELLRHTEARTHLPSPVPHTGRGDPGYL